MRELAPFGLRMEAELKERLMREARLNGRSLNSEIVARLRASLEQYPVVLPAREPRPGNHRATLPEPERELLSRFRALSGEKQLALLALLT